MESKKAFYRIAKRVYDNGDKTQYLIQMKLKNFKNSDWVDLYIKWDQIEIAKTSLDNLIKIDNGDEKYKDEIVVA